MRTEGSIGTPVMPPVLAAERLRNARRINAFRLVGLLTSLALEGFFTVTVPGWIRAPLPLFAGWTVIAAALFVGGLRSEQAARAGSLAIAFVDMPMLLLLVSHIIDAMRAAGFGTDAAPDRTRLHPWCHHPSAQMAAAIAEGGELRREARHQRRPMGGHCG
jgi:hypothetical protein